MANNVSQCPLVGACDNQFRPAPPQTLWMWVWKAQSVQKLVLLGQLQKQPHWTPGCWLWTFASFLFMEILPQTKKNIYCSGTKKKSWNMQGLDDWEWGLLMKAIHSLNGWIIIEWLASKKYTVINEQSRFLWQCTTSWNVSEQFSFNQWMCLCKKWSVVFFVLYCIFFFLNVIFGDDIRRIKAKRTI